MRRDGIPTRRPSRRGGEWTPKDIGGITLWLRGDLGITPNATEVAAWADQSGQGNHVAQGSGPAQPTFVASDADLGGHPSVLFSGGGDFLLMTNSVTLAWVAFVCRHPSTTWPTSNVLASADTTAANSIFLIGESGTANWLTSGGATMLGTRVRNGVTTNVALGTANQPFLYEFTPATPNGGTTVIGNYGNLPTFGFAGAIAEVFGATSVPNESTLTALRAYVASRYRFAI